VILMESPLVWQTWAWSRSRSTVAVARVLGMSSSKPTGCRFEEIATERFEDPTSSGSSAFVTGGALNSRPFFSHSLKPFC
jgi:hypothetical protein